MTRLVLHIGTEKTGSTTIQKFLDVNRDALSDRRFYTPRTMGNPTTSAVNHLALCILAQNPDTEYKTPRLLAGIQDGEVEDFVRTERLRFEAEMSSLPPFVHTVVMSSEFLHSQLVDPDEINRLYSYLSQLFSEIEILVYLRRQDLLALSLFSTRIKGGEPWPKEVFPEIDNDIPYYFDYLALLKNYADVFGGNSVKVRKFEKAAFTGGRLTEDFLDAVGLTQEDSLIGVEDHNPSLDVAALKLLAALNPYVPPFLAGKWNPLRNGLVELLEKHFQGKSMIATRSKAKRFYSNFKHSNETARRLFAPHFEAPLFLEDFGSYPLKAKAVADLPAALATMVAVLWNEHAKDLNDSRAEASYLAIELMKSAKLPRDVISGYYERTLRLHGDWPKIHDSYAHWLSSLGETELAEHHVEIARSLASQH